LDIEDGGAIIGGGAILLLLGGPIIVLLFCPVGGGVGAGYRLPKLDIGPAEEGGPLGPGGGNPP